MYRIFVISYSCTVFFAGNTGELTDSCIDNAGTRFTLMFPQTADASNPIELFVTSTSLFVTFIELFTPSAIDLGVSSYVIAPQGHLVISLPAELRSSGSGFNNRGLVLSASQRVTLHMINLNPRSCGGFMAIPDNRLGYDYVAVGYESGAIQQLGIVARTETVQLAIVPPPNVTLMFNGAIFSGSNGDVISDVTLERFTVLQLQGLLGQDLTGVRVVATDRIAVFSGSVLTMIDFESQDHIVEQLLPRGGFGRIFNAVPIPLRTEGVRDTLRIVSMEFNNTVFIGPDDVNPNNRLELRNVGSRAEVVISRELQVRALREVAVVQFSASRILNDRGEPTMFLVPPIERFKNVFHFTIPTSNTDNFTAYVIITVRSADQESLLLDNSPLNSFVTPWQQIPSPANDYLGGSISVTSGRHVLSSTNRNVTFSAIVYIFDQPECAVAFPAGMCLDYDLEVRLLPVWRSVFAFAVYVRITGLSILHF